MSKHEHSWTLIDTHDGSPKYRPLPTGQWISRGGFFGGVTYIPGFDMQTFREHLIDTIQSSELPYLTSQTYSCHCGEIKINTQEHDGIGALMKRIKQ